MISTAVMWQANKTGAFASLPFDKYLSAPGVSKSALDHFHDCPRQYRQFIAGAIEDEATKEMMFGKVGHALVLEGRRDYHVRPATYRPDGKKWTMAANDCKAWMAAHSDKDVLSPDDASMLESIAAYIRSHPKASGLLASGQPEVSVFATDPQTGIFLKGRPDWVAGDDLLDLKFLADVSARELPRTIIRRRYHVQLAMYRRLCGLNGIHPKRFWLLAVERVAWGKIHVRQVPKAIIDIGEIELDRDLSGLKACQASGIWPDPSGAADDDAELMFPNWAYFPEGEDSDDPLIIGGKSFQM